MAKTSTRARKRANDTEFHPSLEDQVGYQLRMAQLAVFGDIIDALKETGLRPVDLSALMLIDANPGIKQATICARLRMQRPNVVALVDSLEGRNLVGRQVNEEDRRANQIHLTEAGHALLRRALELQHEHSARINAVLEGVDIDNLMLALKRLSTLSNSK